jgi:hypothetical protein
MLAPVIVRILAGATRRFRRVGATPRHAPSVHVNEGRCLRACPRPGDGPCQLRKRRSRGRWIGPEACRAGPKPLARPRDDKADQRSEEPYAASRTSGTAAAPRTTSRHQHWKPDEPRRRRPSASARRSHITQPSDDGYLRSCALSWRGCPGRRAAHRPREPARACAPTTPRTMKGASIVKVECESGLSPPPHPIPSCPWPTPQPTKDTPPRSTKPRGGSQVDQRVIDTYAVQALAAVPLRARMR